MELYRLHESPSGKDLSARTKIFQTEVDQIFEQYYPETAGQPNDLIHVSCTGYVSPSGAQNRLEEGVGAIDPCDSCLSYGLLRFYPAIGCVSGFLSSGVDKKQVDIVHTELCPLHSNPANHQLDQLVSQSLFADGFMKYSMLQSPHGPSIKVLALREEIIPIRPKR